jgi:limonene-1,2-epoxide hydrolase
MRIWIAGCVVALSACASSQVNQGHIAKTPVAIIESYFAALNRHDLSVLTLYVTPDFEWYSQVDGERIVEVSGREALSAMLTRYFAESRSAQWSLLHAEPTGPFVATVERSQWNENGGMRSRTGLGVYEIENERIRRVTYFLSSQ